MLRKGDRVALMLPNLLQYPVAMFGALRAGLVVVNVNPQYTPTELEHQLLDSGAAAIVVLENFAHTLQEVLQRQPQLRAGRRDDRGGRHVPALKEVLTNAVVKYVKKLVPPWKIAGAVEFNAALRAGRDLVLQDVALDPRRPCLPAVHRRHHRRGQGRGADPRQHGGQPAAVVGLDRAAACSTARRSSSARCRCTTSTR